MDKMRKMIEALGRTEKQPGVSPAAAKSVLGNKENNRG